MSRATIYGDSVSGNCYKLRLAASQLSFDCDWKETSVLSGETRSPAFRALNPNGKVPLLVLDDGRCLPESNAILWFMAEGSALVGTDRYERASVLAWLFFEQYSHEPYIATSRFIVRLLGNPPERQGEVEAKRAPGYRALGVMDKHLEKHDFFANDSYSIADIALFAYTHVADEGGFDLTPCAAIHRWLDRVRTNEGFVPMQGR